MKKLWWWLWFGSSKVGTVLNAKEQLEVMMREALLLLTPLNHFQLQLVETADKG